jgi:YrbI family 3-deoxy-D-manno-octulosonate 8-phosphate phosphatase
MIGTIVFDFDGIFTDNFVYTSSQGYELVRTSRSDSYGLSLFKEYILLNSLDVKMFILSTERDNVVRARAEKLGLDCYLGVGNKLEFLSRFLETQNKESFKGVVFFGNDLNDIDCMKMAEFSFCPLDAHPKIKEISTHVLESRGGDGFVREALEFIQEHMLAKGEV